MNRTAWYPSHLLKTWGVDDGEGIIPTTKTGAVTAILVLYMVLGGPFWVLTMTPSRPRQLLKLGFSSQVSGWERVKRFALRSGSKAIRGGGDHLFLGCKHTAQAAALLASFINMKHCVCCHQIGRRPADTLQNALQNLLRIPSKKFSNNFRASFEAFDLGVDP